MFCHPQKPSLSLPFWLNPRLVITAVHTETVTLFTAAIASDARVHAA